MKPVFTIADMCKKRLGIGDGAIVSKRMPPITYRDESGELIKLRDLAAAHKTSQQLVRKAFVRNNLDYIAANKELGERL